MKNIKEDWKEEFRNKFGQFAIMGSAGRIYNGAVDPSVRLSDIEAFIQQSIDTAVKEQLDKIIDPIQPHINGKDKYEQ